MQDLFWMSIVILFGMIGICNLLSDLVKEQKETNNLLRAGVKQWENSEHSLSDINSRIFKFSQR